MVESYDVVIIGSTAHPIAPFDLQRLVSS